MSLNSKILKLLKENEENLFSPRRIKNREEDNRKEFENMFLEYMNGYKKVRGKYSERTQIDYFSKEGYHLFSYNIKKKTFNYDTWFWYYKPTGVSFGPSSYFLELAKILVRLIKKYLHIDLTGYTYRNNKLNESGDLFNPRRINIRKDNFEKRKNELLDKFGIENFKNVYAVRSVPNDKTHLPIPDFSDENTKDNFSLVRASNINKALQIAKIKLQDSYETVVSIFPALEHAVILNAYLEELDTHHLKSDVNFLQGKINFITIEHPFQIVN